ncbi:MAG: MFS transporter [Anaerolineales bacterium]|nr:MFS transporter [Anaerolineales bacterium]
MHSENNRPALQTRAARFFGLGIELISLMFISRLLVDTSNRIFFPFIPQFSAGLGLTITAFSWVLSIRALAGIASPLIGMLADRHGRRLVMSVMLVVRGLTLISLPMFHGWWCIFPMVLLSLTTAGYIPVLRAYLSDMVSSNRRGRALAAVDASFSTAGIVGLPVVGWLIETWNWQVPLIVIGILHLAAVLVVSLRLPKTTQRTQDQTMFAQMKELVRQPGVLASMGVSSLLLLIFFLFMMFWAFLLTDRFNFSPIQVGLMGTWIGIAEFSGLLLAGIFIDRIGKRRGSMIGMGLSAILFLIFPLFEYSLPAVRILLVLLAAAIEFTITSVIPLYAEQNTELRATVFCLIMFGDTIGSGVTPTLTTYLWTHFGLTAVVLVGFVTSMLALLLVWRYLYDQRAGGGAR